MAVNHFSSEEQIRNRKVCKVPAFVAFIGKGVEVIPSERASKTFVDGNFRQVDFPVIREVRSYIQRLAVVQLELKVYSKVPLYLDQP